MESHKKFPHKEYTPKEGIDLHLEVPYAIYSEEFYSFRRITRA
jgi:hypothetical protein